MRSCALIILLIEEKYIWSSLIYREEKNEKKGASK